MGDFLRTLGSFSRLIRFDKRGTGMSDPVSGAPSLETRMDDVRAVMDAVGSARAAFYGLSEGAAMSILFAATYPERTAALVVRSCSPRTMWAPDFPWGRKEEAYQREVDQALRVFASRAEAGEAVRALGMQTADEVEAFIDYVRYSTSPGMLDGLYRMNKEIDIRYLLPAVSVPTLVLHGSEDQIVPVEAGGAWRRTRRDGCRTRRGHRGTARAGRRAARPARARSGRPFAPASTHRLRPTTMRVELRWSAARSGS